MGAVGAMAALAKRATEGGSSHVTVNLTKTAMWCGSLGLVDPALPSQIVREVDDRTPANEFSGPLPALRDLRDEPSHARELQWA